MNFKKLIALVLAAVMMTTVVAAFAADGAQMVNPEMDNLISVSGLATGDTVNFYQILEWKGSEGTYGGWSLIAPFTGIVDTSVPALKDAATAIKTIVGNNDATPAQPMALTSEIAGKLADLAKNAAAKTGSTVADGKSTLAIGGESGNTLGLYMALITPKDQDTVYNPVFVSADYKKTNGTDSWDIVTSAKSYSDNSAAKKSKVSVDKKATGTNNGYDLTWQSTRPGEVVSFEVTATIPGYGKVYQDPRFVLKDKLTDMQLTANSVELTAPTGLSKGTGSVDVNSETYDYYIEENTSNNGGYTITFTEKYLKSLVSPVTVTVTYSAAVTSTAKKNVNLEKNEVWIEYSHDPQNESDYNVKKDDTNHYTYTIDADILGNWGETTKTSGSEIIKVGVDADGNPLTETKVKSAVTSENYQTSPLEGAEFKLYTDAACTTEYKKADNNTYALKSDANGRIKIEGLDAGKYWLKETKAPSGYIADQRAVSIEIIPSFTTKSYRQWWNASESKWSDTEISGAKFADFDVEVLKSYKVLVDNVEASSYTFVNDGPQKINISSEGTREIPQSIVNTKGLELPSTGGIGTTLFYIIGSVLVLGAGVLLVTRRRMNEN